MRLQGQHGTMAWWDEQFQGTGFVCWGRDVQQGVDYGRVRAVQREMIGELHELGPGLARPQLLCGIWTGDGAGEEPMAERQEPALACTTGKKRPKEHDIGML